MDRDKENDVLNVNDIPQFFKLMKGSMLLNVFYEYYIKIVSGKVNEIDFLKEKNNGKYITIGICLLMASSLIGLMSYFLFYVMFFFSSLKCILWLFEHYNPELSSDEDIELITKHYVTEKSPVDVLEYYIVPIFIVLVMHPLAYIPIPFASIIVYSSSVMLGLATMTNKAYRQKFCIFIRDFFTNKESRNEKGEYVSGHECEVHKLLQTLCYSIECINLSTLHITHNPRATFDKLKLSRDIVHGMQIITSDLLISKTLSKDKKQNSNDTSSLPSISTDTDDELDEY